MEQYIPKSALVAEIEKKKKYAQTLGDNAINSSMQQFYDGMKQGCVDILSTLDTLEVKDPYEQVIQYPNIEDGIKAHAEDYSFNIESELFQQLTKEQQELWRKEIEQACISGGYSGFHLAKDPRYKENLEMKEVDLEKELESWRHNHFHGRRDKEASGEYLERVSQLELAKHFYELGIKAKNK